MAVYKLEKKVAYQFRKRLLNEQIAYVSWPACRDDDVYVVTEGYDRDKEELLLSEAQLEES